VLDLTEQDFKDISNVTGRLFKIEVHRSDGRLFTVVCPNSEFLKHDLKGKHSCLNAFSAKDLCERVRHVLSACATNPFEHLCLCSHQAVNASKTCLF
jgi:hypothetical protein